MFIIRCVMMGWAQHSGHPLSRQPGPHQAAPTVCTSSSLECVTATLNAITLQHRQLPTHRDTHTYRPCPPTHGLRAPLAPHPNPWGPLWAHLLLPTIPSHCHISFPQGPRPVPRSPEAAGQKSGDPRPLAAVSSPRNQGRVDRHTSPAVPPAVLPLIPRMETPSLHCQLCWRQQQPCHLCLVLVLRVWQGHRGGEGALSLPLGVTRSPRAPIPARGPPQRPSRGKEGRCCRRWQCWAQPQGWWVRPVELPEGRRLGLTLGGRQACAWPREKENQGLPSPRWTVAPHRAGPAWSREDICLSGWLLKVAVNVRNNETSHKSQECGFIIRCAMMGWAHRSG